MTEALVLSQREDGIAILTINRPSALNALNQGVLEALGSAITALEGDDDLRCVVLTGAGEKSFVAGADIGEMSAMGPTEAKVFSSLGHGVLDRLAGLNVPVIAAVNGFCLGGGCELSLACDLVYASEKARFGQPEVKLGLIPGFGGTQRLARRIGAMAAADLVLSGRMVKADEALRMGLCLEVLPADGFLEAVMEKARTIAAQGPVAVRAAKAVQAMGLDAPLATANAFEREAFANLFDGYDAKEGMKAFVEKRAASFKGPGA